MRRTARSFFFFATRETKPRHRRWIVVAAPTRDDGDERASGAASGGPPGPSVRARVGSFEPFGGGAFGTSSDAADASRRTSSPGPGAGSEPDEAFFSVVPVLLAPPEAAEAARPSPVRIARRARALASERSTLAINRLSLIHI